MFLDLNNKQNSEFKYEFYFMPDGQPHIKLEHHNSVNTIKCSLTSMNDLGKLMVAVSALKSNNQFNSETKLTIPYFLGARQDRFMQGEAITVKIIADIINRMNFSKVNILHPHSDAISVLVNEFREYQHHSYVIKSTNSFKPDFLIIPDLGAAKNAKNYLMFGLPMVQCDKVRDSKTGKLSGFRCFDDIPLGKGMIIDDLCDGGGTFIGLADIFKNNELALYTTHGLYTKGLTNLNRVFSKIYCTNSYHYNNDLGSVEGFDPTKNIIYSV